MMRPDVQERKALYAAVWRWHFYAGLYVAPFLMLLATTGLVMLARDSIERSQWGSGNEHFRRESCFASGEARRGSNGVSQCDVRALSARPGHHGCDPRHGHP